MCVSTISVLARYVCFVLVTLYKAVLAVADMSTRRSRGWVDSRRRTSKHNTSLSTERSWISSEMIRRYVDEKGGG